MDFIINFKTVSNEKTYENMQTLNFDNAALTDAEIEERLIKAFKNCVVANKYAISKRNSDAEQKNEWSELWNSKLNNVMRERPKWNIKKE